MKPGFFLILLSLSLPLSPAASPLPGDVAGARQDEAVPARGKQGDAPAACVLGRIITVNEIRAKAAEIRKVNPDRSEVLIAWRARRELARRLLLLETAKRHGSEITNDEVINHYAQNVELDPELVKQNINEFRDEFMIFLYQRCRMGLDSGMKNVVPDMAAHLRITPEEMRSYFRNHPEVFTQGKRVVLERFRFPWGLKGRTAAEEFRKLLEQPGVNPEEAAGKIEGCRYSEQEYEGRKYKDLSEQILKFVVKGKIGSVSQIIETEFPQPTHNLFRIKEKREERTLAFHEVREELAKVLQDNRILLIKILIVDDLVAKEWRSCWPADLFNLNPTVVQAPGGSEQASPPPKK